MRSIVLVLTLILATIVLARIKDDIEESSYAAVLKPWAQFSLAMGKAASDKSDGNRSSRLTVRGDRRESRVNAELKRIEEKVDSGK